MFIFLGMSKGVYKVFDSDDKKVGDYTKAEIDYAASVGTEIKYYDSDKGHYIDGVDEVKGSSLSAYPIIVLDVHKYGAGIDMKTHEYHMYNLQTNSTTVLNHVPYQYRNMLVSMTKLTYADGVYYYEFEGSMPVKGVIKTKLLGSTLRMRNTGTIKEGIEWEPYEFDNFVRVTE